MIFQVKTKAKIVLLNWAPARGQPGTGDAGRRRHRGRLQGRRRRLQSVAHRAHILGEWTPYLQGCGYLFHLFYNVFGLNIPKIDHMFVCV